MNIPNFSIPNLHLNIPTTNILLLILILVIIVFGVVSGALIYHWRKYGMGRRKFFFVQMLYMSVAIALIIMAAISVIFI